jgi:hypothetical protein
MKSILKAVAVTSSLAVAQVAFAQKASTSQLSPFSYSYIQAGYGSASLKTDGASSVTLDGFNISGSVALNETVFAIGSYQDSSGKVSGVTISVDSWSLGAGMRFPIAPSTDLVGTFSYINQKTGSSGGSSETTTGYSGDVGFRHLLSEAVEVNGTVGMTIAGDDNDRQTDWGLGVLVKVSKQSSVGLAYQGSSFDGGSSSLVGAAIRFEF